MYECTDICICIYAALASLSVRMIMPFHGDDPLLGKAYILTSFTTSSLGTILACVALSGSHRVLSTLTVARAATATMRS